LTIIYIKVVQWSVLWREFVHNIKQGEFNEAKNPSLPDIVQLAVIYLNNLDMYNWPRNVS
jgi:hypothetical protein